MPVDFIRNSTGRAWHTMTGGDIAICMDYANTFDRHRGPAWMESFAAKAEQLGYRDGAGRCNCVGQAHGPECLLAKPYRLETVWPHDDADDGLLLTDRLPSPANDHALPPVETVRPVQAHALPPIPDDAPEYAGGIPESDPDDLRDAA